jgi:tRNA(fMet)-specific endonuclease VapC
MIIALFAQDTEVQDRLQSGIEIYVPVIVVGELFYGLNKSRYYDSNLRKIEDFLQTVTILNCDEATARQYGGIKQNLKDKGTPLPENDIWIAAIAKQHDLMLVSRDSHFEKVSGLTIETWLAQQP